MNEPDYLVVVSVRLKALVGWNPAEGVEENYRSVYNESYESGCS